MFTHFNQAEKSVHYPSDRRMYISIKPYIVIFSALIVFVLIGGAWLQYLLFGLPADPSVSFSPITFADPVGFPAWLNISHWVNFFFLILIIRSGLSVLVDHPRLYWNNGCTPGTEWIRFTPVKVPDDKVWTAKEDARYISPAVGLPGYKHTIGIARVWHFLTVPFFLLNGAVFIVLLFCTNQWKRLVPVSWKIIPDGWNVFVHYATFNMPVEPNGFYHYNAIQQLSYFGVVFILGPLAMLTGMAMSPAIENRFHWYPKLFGNRQGARSIHFLVMIAFVIFIVIHVSLVAATGLVRNMNHIDNCLKPQSILAWEMNYETLPLIHGAPIRLRVENQLGYKMVKWISSIEFVQTHKSLGRGFGGKNEDDEYFDLLADT